MRGRVRLGRGLRVEHELHDARAVAQVDEDQPAVVAAAVHPAGDARLRAGALGGQLAAPGVAVAVGSRSRASRQSAPSQDRRDHGVGRQLALLAATPCSSECTSASSPTIATYRAPIRSACLSWPLQRPPGELELGAQARAPRVSCASANAARAPVGARPAPRTGRPARRDRQLAGGQQDPLDAGRPAGGRRRRPAELLDQAVVAPAAADAGLGAERVAGELEHACACSSRGRAPASGRARRGSRRRRAARAPARSARRPRRSAGRAASARLVIDLAGARGRSRRTRASGSGRSGRDLGGQLVLVRAQVGGQLLAVLGAGLGRAEARRAAAACPRRRSPRAARRAARSARRRSRARRSRSPRRRPARTAGSGPRCGASARKKLDRYQSFTGWGSLCIPCSR